MKFIVKYMPEREAQLIEMKKQIPNVVVVQDIMRSHMDTFIRALEEAGDESAVHLEDDIILCDNFVERCLEQINLREDRMIQFFSMRKADLEVGSRYDYGANFLMNQCVYYPAGYSKMIKNYWLAWDRKEEHPSGSDTMIADFLKSRKEKYYIVVPNLVDHVKGKSVIDPRRSSKRISKTFKG